MAVVPFSVRRIQFACPSGGCQSYTEALSSSTLTISCLSWLLIGHFLIVFNFKNIVDHFRGGILYFIRQKWVQLSIDWMIYSQLFPTCIILFAYFSGYSKTSFEVREKRNLSENNSATHLAKPFCQQTNY